MNDRLSGPVSSGLLLKPRMRWNWPNTLTWLRIYAIPLIAVLFYLPYPWGDPAAGLLFAAAGITDSLDGYLAGSGDHRPRDHDLGVTGVDGRDRPAT
jgi:hypothetical protein